MKKLLISLAVFGALLTGCKDDTEDPDPVDSFVTSLDGTLKSTHIATAASGIVSTYYSDQGENAGALEVAATLSGGEKLIFFVEDAKAGTVTLSQTFPAVMEGNSQGKRISVSTLSESKLKTQVTLTSYVKYLQSNTSYFALSGTFVIKIEGENLTLDWRLTFKDLQGNTYASQGTLKLKDFKANQKPRSEINNPTSELSIFSIMPDYGKAGTEVSIRGAGFSALKSENKITLGDIDLETSSASATELKVVIPENGVHSAIKVDVMGSSTESGTFYYEPIVSSPSNLGPKTGDQITITGKHFDSDKTKLEVKIGEKTMEIISSTLTTIVVKIPEETVSGKLFVARKGKTAVEGPEITIIEDPVEQGPPIDDVFGVVSGNLSFEEVLMNSNQYGPFWTFEIDRANHKLYAVGRNGIVEIDLDTKSSQLIVNDSDQVYLPELGNASVSTIPQALFPDGKGNLYGVKSPLAAIFGTTNIFKIDLSSKSSSMIGNSKINSAGVFAGMYVSDDRIYLTRALGGYDLLSFDLNMGNAKTLLNYQSKRASDLIPMGGNKLRLLRDQKIQELYYSQVDGSTVTGPFDWSGAVNSLRPADGAGAEIVGLEYFNGNFIGMFASLDEEYTIGVQAGASGNFEKKGEFTIKQTYEYNGTTYPILAYEIDDTLRGNVMVVDKNGDIYFLLQSPTNAQGNPIAGPLGGIYRVSF